MIILYSLAESFKVETAISSLSGKIMKSVDWIGSQFGVLPRIFCILSGIRNWSDERLRCSNVDCKRVLNDIKMFKSVAAGFNTFCSRKCACNDKSVQHKKVLSQRANNNGSYFSEKTMEHRKKTFISHYGVDNNMKSVKGKEELRKAVEEKYGVSNVFQLDETKTKSRATKKELYGDENFNNGAKISSSLRSKGESFYEDRDVRTKKTNKMRFGEDHPMKVESIAAEASRRSSESLLKKYGVKSYSQTTEYRMKSNKTSMKNYGTSHPMQNADVRKRQQIATRSLEADGISFDSSWELAFYLYHKNLGHDITYNQDISFSYICNEQLHVYIPDFILDGKFYEIKGDQFFNESGDLICPYSDSLTQKQIEDLNQIAKAKQQCMKDHDVIVIRRKDIQPILHDIEKNLGKGWKKLYLKESYTSNENRSK